jgi:hypothetical protein
MDPDGNIIQQIYPTHRRAGRTLSDRTMRAPVVDLEAAHADMLQRAR